MKRRKRHYTLPRTDKNREKDWASQGILDATVELYDKLLLAQQGRCAICYGRPNRIRLCLDHDHKTGKARGLLCKQCNYYLGWFEVPGRLDRLIQYLKDHSPE